QSRAVSLTGIERGTYSVRVVRTSPLQERFRFRGTGAIEGLGQVRVTGDVTLTEDASQAGSASGLLTLTLPGGNGTARAVVSQTIPAHTGSIGSLPFSYTFSGGTGRFRGGVDRRARTPTPPRTPPAPPGAHGGLHPPASP